MWHVFTLNRKLSSQKLLPGKWVDVRDALCSRAFESRAAFSTSVHDFAAKGLEFSPFLGLFFIYFLIVTRVCDSLLPFFVQEIPMLACLLLIRFTREKLRSLFLLFFQLSVR